MRLLMVAHSDAPWTPHYSRYFKARGDEVLVVTFAPDRIEGIETVFMGVEPFDFRKNKRLFLTRVPRVRRIIRAFRPDLVYAPYLTSNGMTAVLSSKSPVIVAARGGDVFEHAGSSGPRQWFREAVVRFVCGRAAMVHTVSQGLDNELMRLGVPVGKLFRIPVGVNVEQFHPREEGPRKDATRLVCVRRHQRVYDIPTILHALARLRSSGRRFTCTMAGGGTRLEMHKALAAELGLTDVVTFLGHQPHDRLPALFRDSDIYISASLSDGTASSLLEAMASGILPVVSRIRANGPWIEHGVNGLLFETGRPESLAEVLATAMADGDLRRRAFRENPRRVDQDGNMAKNMDRLAAVFEEVAFRSRCQRR
ncbi:MAG TPA: glycosyltransferase [Phycisphaerae bacterium]|nr:glycosyltransferase [Phycisphaerae bacterium]HRY66798.1 glycosyltransferase [Phycisphaerae bacterium]